MILLAIPEEHVPHLVPHNLAHSLYHAHRHRRGRHGGTEVGDDACGAVVERVHQFDLDGALGVVSLVVADLIDPVGRAGGGVVDDRMKRRGEGWRYVQYGGVVGFEGIGKGRRTPDVGEGCVGLGVVFVERDGGEDC